jgi:hypothetical protein
MSVHGKIPLGLEQAGVELTFNALVQGDSIKVNMRGSLFACHVGSSLCA